MAAPNPQHALGTVMSQALRRREGQLSTLRAEIAEPEQTILAALTTPSSEHSAAIAASSQSKMTSMMTQEKKLQEECLAKSQV